MRRLPIPLTKVSPSRPCLPAARNSVVPSQDPLPSRVIPDRSRLESGLGRAAGLRIAGAACYFASGLT